MKITDHGLVLREVKLREADKILTLLTAENGIVSVSARGSMRPNNKLFAASGLYSYSEWTLHEGKTMFSADDAAPLEVFFGLRSRIEAVALAAYIAELLQLYHPTGQEGGTLLRLALNSLHLLSEDRREPALVKAVFELRSLAETGFMPEVAECAACGREESESFFFDLRQGELLCAACAGQQGLVPSLGAGAAAALRHIVQSAPEDLYRFSLTGDSLAALGQLAQQYLLVNLDYPPKTLAFLQTVL